MKTTIKLEESTAIAARGLRNTPLQASIQNGVLVLAIGVDTLAWAAITENGGPLENLSVVDADVFAADVCTELMRETTGYNEQPEACKWLDEMIDAAAERGSAGLE